MKDEKEIIKDWDFDYFKIQTDKFTNWDMYEKLREYTNKDSKVLDIGCGGGEKIFKFYPEYLKEVLGTDLSHEMIKTAKKHLLESKRKNISFRVMDNLNMDVNKNYYDVVVARHTVSDPKQIYDVLKPNGHLIIRGVDMYDAYSLKRTFGYGQAYNDSKPISIIDYENVLDADLKMLH